MVAERLALGQTCLQGLIDLLWGGVEREYLCGVVGILEDVLLGGRLLVF